MLPSRTVPWPRPGLALGDSGDAVRADWAPVRIPGRRRQQPAGRPGRDRGPGGGITPPAQRTCSLLPRFALLAFGCSSW